MRLSVVMFFVLISLPVNAVDCVKYKKNPIVNVTHIVPEKKIIQPDEDMDLQLHGHVMSTMAESYNISTAATFVKTGFCVSLESIDVGFGYNDFIVNIDRNYKPNSCAYNAVLAHENKHINEYLLVFDEFKDDFERALNVAANSVMPVFVEKKSQIDTVIEDFYQKIQNHPEIVLLKQKIRAAEEIRNKRIDQDEDGADLIKCFE
ncbi:MAG: hypothetical protein IKW67_00280 [Alphaproteobacteria bacterium]|nr:hypothetical protein [Alphaproteobacteria bacterium]